MKQPHERYVLCVGLTPAVQETREFARLVPGEVNRSTAITRSAAGKGQNVARVIRTLRAPARLLGFYGGASGAFCLRELAALGVQSRRITVPTATRTCITILDRSERCSTELVEEAALPPAAAWIALHRNYSSLLRRAKLVALSGALMPGAATDTYARMLHAAGKAGVPVIIDSQKAPLLSALPHRPLLAKLNVHELENTAERRLSSPAAIVTGARDLLALGAQSVLVTDGARPAWLVFPDRVLRVTPPRIRALNPIGSGDAVTAGIAVGLYRSQPMERAVALGIACGAANALTLTPGVLSPREVRRLQSRVKVSPVT
jgi:tagatose 6-phosphate kinase